MLTVKCDYCGTIHEVQPGFITLTCRKCGAPMRANFAYYPISVSRTSAAIAAEVADWTVTGADLSYWQGAIDWPRFASKVNFAYLRAGYGNDYTDPRLTEYMRGCADHGIPFGLYWYVKPGKDWRKHADNFAAYEEMGALPPVMDVEETGGLDKQALAGWLEKLVNRYEEVSGRELAIYTSPGFWNSNLPMTNWAKNRSLWVAHWTGAQQPTLPNEWVAINQPKTWTFWQWSAGGNKQGATYGVSSTDIDLNRFNGTAADFERRFGVPPHYSDGAPPVPPEPPAEELPEFVTTTAFALNLRWSPAVVTGNKFGVLPYGTKLKVIGQSGDWYQIAGYVHKDYVK